MSKRQRATRGTVAFDFDGVLSKGANYHWPLTGLDLTLIREAQDRGYAVAVMTCNDVNLVAAELRRLHEDDDVEEEAKPTDKKPADTKPVVPHWSERSVSELVK